MLRFISKDATLQKRRKKSLPPLVFPPPKNPPGPQFLLLVQAVQWGVGWAGDHYHQANEKLIR